MKSWKTDKTITNIKTMKRTGQRYGLKSGYTVWEIKDRWYLAHLLIARKKYGLEDIPAGFQVHHIDGVRTNFKKENLIIVHKKDHRVIHKLMKDLV
jgi:hypothetical protein